MRLIDADAMNEELFYKQVGGKDSLITAESAFEMINSQPTAYDVDKVVETLMNRFRVVSNDEDLEWNRAIDYAVKIVKGGGVDG